MQSRFEKDAQREAVEAVERRWEQKNAVARRAARAASVKFWFACLVIFVALVTGGMFAARHFGIEFPNVREFIDFKHLVQKGGLTDSERANIDSFAAAIASFNGKEIHPWKSVPPEMRPKKAPAGFTYRMLIEKAGGLCGIYEMIADGNGGLSVRELNPVGKATKTTLAAFNKAKVGKVYLVACAGNVYVCGTNDAETGFAFLRRWTDTK